MSKVFAAALSVAFGLSVAISSSVRADDFIRLQPGNFSSANWYNATTGQGPNAGPPGGGDNAFLGGESVTSGGASVLSIGNGTLTLTGPFSAPTISGGLTLSGPGIMTSQTGSAFINGGHLVVQSYTASPVINISNGGSIVAGTIPDGSAGLVSSTGSLTINSKVNDINLTLTGGAVFRAPNVSNGISQTVTINDAGSAFNVDQQFKVNAGFVDINGGMLTVGGQLGLDGGTDQGGLPIGGGGHWQGSTARISTSETMFVGLEKGSFSLGIEGGAFVNTGGVAVGAGPGSSGTITLSGDTTLWQVSASRMTVGQSGTAHFGISAGADLLFDSGTEYVVGQNSGSNGTMTLDGAGSQIDARNALATIASHANSRGTLALTNQASLLLGKHTLIGEGGNGGLSIRTGSKATVSGEFTKFGIGYQAGSSGNVSVQGAASSLKVAGPTIVGVNGTGILSAGQGAQIALDSRYVFKVGASAGGNGMVVLDGAQTSMTVAGLVGVADRGVGKVTISAGGELDANGPSLDVGINAGSDGSIVVTGPDSLLSVATWIPMTVGVSGRGSVVVKDQAQVFSTQGVVVALRDGSTGSISISDAGTLFEAHSMLFGELPIPGPPTGGGAGTITVQNSGKLRLRAALHIRNSTANPSVIIDNGQIAVGTGAFGPPGSLRVSENGTLTGSPKAIRGQVIIGLGGSISPGSSPGVLAIDGSYQQDPGATFLAELGGADAGTGYDQISVSGTATLGGTLNVRLVNGFTPAVGQTFRIVNAAAVSGAFAAISGPSQAGVALTSDATGVTVTVTSVVAGAPVISSGTTAGAAPGAPFSYQIAATNNPTSFGATGLPQGLTVNSNTGVISGTPANAGTFMVQVRADNAAGSGQADLLIQVDTVFSLRTGADLVIEYRNTADFPNSPGGHFFYSSEPAEQSAVDVGAAGQFVRTGRQFLTGGTEPVCRFYGSMTPGPNSHFFTIDVDECNALKALQVTPAPAIVQQWNYEGIGFATTPPVVEASGVRVCPVDTVPLYRAYNNAYPVSGPKNPWDSNHRFTLELADIAAMVASGWRDEGIVFCTAP